MMRVPPSTLRMRDRLALSVPLRARYLAKRWVGLANLHIQGDEVSSFPCVIKSDQARMYLVYGRARDVQEKSSAASSGRRVHLKMATAVDLLTVNTWSQKKS